MYRLNIVLLCLLFTRATEIKGGRKSKSAPQQPQPQQSETIVRTDIKGRPLTAEEGCGLSKAVNTRIVGGSTAKYGSWPWMTLLAYNIGGTYAFRCGGSLITSRHVLTAAHCLKTPLTFARLGEFNIRDDDGKHADIEIVRQIPHEKWNRAVLINDIAIVQLGNDVTFTDRISPICLPDTEFIQNYNYVGSNPFVAGWGHSKEKGRQSNILQQVQLPIISNSDCKEQYKSLGRIVKDIQYSDIVLCAGYADGGKDSCQGDSGGPMMLPMHENGKFPFYQIGIISYSIGCARPNVPGVYTNVRNYIEWIKSKLQ